MGNPMRLYCTACGTLALDHAHQCPTEPLRRIQDRPDFSWVAWRAGGIGSSEAPTVMEDTPPEWSTPYSLWELKTGRAFQSPPSIPMLQGIRAESFIRAWYEKKVGIEMPKDLAIHPKHDFVRASYDGINHGERQVAEFKFAGKKDHARAVSGQIPRKYRYQLVQQLMLCEFQSIDYVSYYAPDRNNPKVGHGIIVPFYREAKFEKKLLSAEMKFWECVLKDTPPKRKAVTQIFKMRSSR